MDWVSLVIGIVIGCVVCIAFFSYLLLKFWAACALTEIKERPFLPPSLAQANQDFVDRHPKPLDHQQDIISSESYEVLNFILDFMFRELRDRPGTNKVFMEMLEKDILDVKNNTAAGRILERVNVKKFFLGKSFPVFQNATLVRTKDGLGEGTAVDVDFRLLYDGGLSIHIEADLIFGKKAQIFVAVAKIEGNMKLELRHFPRPHYTVSFLEEPLCNFEVESVFEGRSYPQLNNLMINHLKRTIRKKHMHPHGKKRYKPFFPTPTDTFDYVVKLGDEDYLHVGLLKIFIDGATGLEIQQKTNNLLYGVISLVPNPRLHGNAPEEDAPTEQYEAKTSMLNTFSVDVVKAGSGGSIGIHLGTEQGLQCKIDSITPGSPASMVDLRVGDTILLVNGVAVKTSQKTAELIRKSDSRTVKITVSRETTATSPSMQPTETTKPAKNRANAFDKTAFVTAARDVTWRQNMTLHVTKEDRFLYVYIYQTKQLAKGEVEKSNKSSKPTLIGTTEISLVNLSVMQEMKGGAEISDKYALRASSHFAARTTGFLNLTLRYDTHKLPADSTPHGPSSSSSLPQTSSSLLKPRAASTSSLNKSRSSSPVPQSGLRSPPIVIDRDGSMTPSSRDSDSLFSFSDPPFETPSSKNISPDSRLRSSTLPSKSQKANGDHLFADMAPAERLEALRSLATTVLQQIDLEEETTAELERQLEVCPDGDRERLEENITASSERLETLCQRWVQCSAALNALDGGKSGKSAPLNFDTGSLHSSG